MRNGFLKSGNLKLLALLQKICLLFAFAVDHPFLAKKAQEKSKILHKKHQLSKKGNEEIIQKQIFS